MNAAGKRRGLDAIADPRALLEGLFEHSPMAYQVYAADGHCLMVNPAFLQLFRSEPPPEYNVFRDDVLERQGFLDLVRRAFAGEIVHIPPHSYDPRELRQLEVRDGRRVGIEVTLFPLRDAAGAVGHVALSFKDVTAELEHRQASEALRASEARYHRLADAGIIGIVTADVHGNFLDANDAFLDMVSFTREEILSGKVRWADMTPAEWKHLDDRAIEDLRAAGVATAWEKEYLRKDGSRVPVLVGCAMLEGAAGECICFILDLTGRRRTEEALLRSERRFHRLADSGIMGIVLADGAGNIKEANDAFLAMVRYSRQDLAAGRVSEKSLNTPEREQTDGAARAQLRTQGVAHPWETELVRKDGSRVPVMNGVVMLDETTDESMAFVLDLTERKRAEAAGRESEARKTAVMEAALDAIVVMDHEGTITEFNPAAERTFGYLSAEAMGKSLAELIIPASLRDKHKEGLRRYLDTGQGPILGTRFEVPALRKDGSEFPAEVAIVRIPSGGQPMFTGYIRDITDRRHAAEAEMLRREKEAAEEANTLLNAVIEGTSDAVYAKDRAGRYLLMNTAGAELAKARPVDMLGRTAGTFLPEEQANRVEEQARLVMADGLTRTYENTVTLGCEERTFLVTNGPRRDAGGVIVGLIGIAREITDRKRGEDALRRAKEAAEIANRELEAFSYSIAHDLRAPLRAINGFSSVLAADYADKLDDEAKGYLNRITSGADRMAQLIDALLSLARLSRTEARSERVDLSQLAHRSIEALREQEPLRVVAFAAAEGVVAQGDPHLLRALMDNLIGNAWKFTSKRNDARIEFGREEAGGDAVYYVRDNGVGFDMALVEKLFAPFRRLHKSSDFEGTGIGLATVQRIVLRHGGRIWAEGAVNGGATFRFTLGPAAPSERSSGRPIT